MQSRLAVVENIDVAQDGTRVSASLFMGLLGGLKILNIFLKHGAFDPLLDDADQPNLTSMTHTHVTGSEILTRKRTSVSVGVPQPCP